MVGIDRNFDYLNTRFFAGFTDNAFSDHRDIASQYLSTIFRGEHHMIRQQRYCMPVMTQFFPVHITTLAFTGQFPYMNPWQVVRKYSKIKQIFLILKTHKLQAHTN
jgi:hypothetical protein